MTDSLVTTEKEVLATDKGLRIVFAGTPEFAAQTLQAILKHGQHQVVAVYSQPDRKSGRGKKIQATPVKQVALDHQIPVYQPLSFKDNETLNELKALNADIMVVVAYGMLLPETVLNTPKFACINVHASLLPRWRGAAPIERAIEAGDKESGVTIMHMDIGLDTGNMLKVAKVAISDDTNGDLLRSQLCTLGQQALLDTLNEFWSCQRNNQPAPKGEVQDNTQANYAKKLSKEEAIIDWHLPAHTLLNKIKAFNSSNVCYSYLGKERIKVWQAEIINDEACNDNSAPGTILAADKKGILVSCGHQCLRLLIIQAPNAKAMTVAAVLNSKKDWFAIGKQFSQHEIIE
jgi:methionyl-tRNA formyltransferase